MPRDRRRGGDAAPLRASLDAGEARAIQRIPSFVDGIGGASVLPAMWPLVRQVVSDSVVVTLADIAEAIRLLVRHARIVAEGAGAAPLAVSRSGAPADVASCALCRAATSIRGAGDDPPGIDAAADPIDVK
jgi:threonine dehydratase